MKWRALLRESWVVALHSRVPSLLCVLVVAATCATALLTVGRTAATNAEVIHQLEQQGARQLTVVDLDQSGFINTRTLHAVQSLASVESATALGQPFDVTNGAIGAGGQKAPAWQLFSEVTEIAEVVRGRLPRPGEALVSESIVASLGMAVPVGYLVDESGRQYPVVGSFRPRAGYQDLAAGMLVAATDDATARELRVRVGRIVDAGSTVSAVLAILDPPRPDRVTVDSPTAMAERVQQLSDQLAGAARQLLLLIMASGGVLVGAVVLSDVLVRRRDLGRRRALGITRIDLVLLVVLRTGWTAGLGAVVGCVAAWVWTGRQDPAIPVGIVAAIGVLALASAVASCIPPAVFASLRDPVRVLRTA